MTCWHLREAEDKILNYLFGFFTFLLYDHTMRHVGSLFPNKGSKDQTRASSIGTVES